MMIQASDLCFGYTESSAATLHSLNFSVARGETLCLLGLNGSGKSTLFSLLAGILPPTSGSLKVGGCELPGQSATLRGMVALLPQDPDWYILGSLVREDLLLGIGKDEREREERALALAGEFGLGDFLDQPTHVLSYGQKRKLCLASALAASPALLLLDEPFAGLDYPAALVIRDILLRNKAKGLTQILTGHELDLMADMADSFMLLADGTCAVTGDASKVFPLLAAAGVRPPCWWAPAAPSGWGKDILHICSKG